MSNRRPPACRHLHAIAASVVSGVRLRRRWEHVPFVAAEVAAFEDAMFAYLLFGHLRGLAAGDGCRAWLTYERKGKALSYIVRLGPPGRRTVRSAVGGFRPGLRSAGPPEVLTTYAGLFFRDLLDRFQGDVARAVGAYNGGPRNPNLQYEAGVRTVAEHARRVLEHAAVLQGRPAAGMRFLTPAR